VALLQYLNIARQHIIPQQMPKGILPQPIQL